MPRPDFVCAMAPTEDTLQMFRTFLPETCIYDSFRQDVLERAVQTQRELISKGKRRTLLILLDDIMYQKGVLKSTTMRYLFFNGRHEQISLVCCAQYLMDIDVSLRTNIDYVVSMRENILVNRQKLHKFFFGQFNKFDEFDKVFSACTSDYKALVLDGTVSSTEPTDSVRWYKASLDIPSFKLCRPIYWELAKRFALSEEDIRRAQHRQFEIEKAAVEAKQQGKKGAVMVVQTEDEHGNVVSSSA